MAKFVFDQVSFSYGRGQQIFDALSFELNFPDAKQFVLGIMGGSGTGKSTILKLILGIHKLDNGTILFNHKNQRIGYVPQEPVLFEHLSILENASYFKKIDGLKADFSENLFQDLAEILGLKSILESKKNVLELSGGQKQRLSLLRALSVKPGVLLLDEPLTGLDEEIKETFLRSLSLILEQFNLFVIYVSHHAKELEFISDNILYLRKKKIGSSADVLSISKTGDFFSIPPNIEALQAIKKTETNLIPCWIVNGEIRLANPTGDLSQVFLAIEQDTIEFTNGIGIEFVKISQTTSFVMLKLASSEVVLTLCSAYFYSKVQPLMNIIISGSAIQYDHNGNFVSFVQLNNNCIIK